MVNFIYTLFTFYETDSEKQKQAEKTRRTKQHMLKLIKHFCPQNNLRENKHVKA